MRCRFLPTRQSPTLSACSPNVSTSAPTATSMAAWPADFRCKGCATGRSGRRIGQNGRFSAPMRRSRIFGHRQRGGPGAASRGSREELCWPLAYWHDSSNGGYIHAPSLTQARTAAVLRSRYLANATPANPGPSPSTCRRPRAPSPVDARRHSQRTETSARCSAIVSRPDCAISMASLYRQRNAFGCHASDRKLRETCVLMTEISAFLGVRPRAGPPRNSLQTRVESSGLPKTRCRLRIDLEPTSIWGMSR